jgi:anti-sigma regulatory factor (Ser/Thr protein kinase)
MGMMIERSERFLLRVGISTDEDIALAMRHVRQLAQLEGFTETGRDDLAAAVADVARNIADDGGGEILLGLTHDDGRNGIVVLSRVTAADGVVVRMKKWLTRDRSAAIPSA